MRVMTTRRRVPPLRVGLVKGLLYAFVISWTVVQVFPLFFMLFAGLKNEVQFNQNPFLPSWPFHFENYATVWSGGELGVPIGRYFLNSVIITAGSLVVLLLAASLCGYALARFPFPGRAFLHKALIGFLAVPIQATVIAVFVLMGTLNLRNTYHGMMLLYAAHGIPFATLLLRAYFLSFPREVEEAARLDGCTDLGTFWRVVLPISRGAIASVAIISVVGIWSEFLFAFVLLNKAAMKTLPAGIYAFRDEFTAVYSLIFAGLTIAAFPTVLFFFLFQRQITKGLTFGAVK